MGIDLKNCLHFPQFSSEEASYAEAKYQLSYNQYFIQIIVKQ